MTDKKITHENDEKTVKCPVEGCDEEVLSRGLHLHVMRSSSGEHGEQNSVPDDVDLDSAEEVGTKTVEMEYPEERDNTQEARLCPYCERPFTGKHGVIIHLGKMEGRKNHPEDAKERHEPDDFQVVTVDENENVLEILDEGSDDATMPSTRRRTEDGSGDVNIDDIQEHIEDLRKQGLDEQADRAEKMLLGK